MRKVTRSQFKKIKPGGLMVEFRVGIEKGTCTPEVFHNMVLEKAIMVLEKLEVNPECLETAIDKIRKMRWEE